MPTRNYTSPGTYFFSVPLYVTRMGGTVIGGGGGGYRDNDGDDEGGGGGGGAFVATPGRNRVTSFGQSIRIVVGAGGPGRSGGSGGNPGSDSSISGWSGTSITARGGRTGTDDNGGGGGGIGSAAPGDTIRSGAGGADDDAGRQGGPAGGCGGSGSCPSNRGGRGATLNGGCNGCPGGRSGTAYGGGGAGNDGGSSGSGNRGAARIIYEYDNPVITSFTSTTQTSSNGIPQDTVRLDYSTLNAVRVRIRQDSTSGPVIINGAVPNGPGSGYLISTGLQSTAFGNSPATRTYCLEATGNSDSGAAGGVTVRQCISVQVFNDDTPASISNSSNAFPTGVGTGGPVPLNELNPSTQYYIIITWNNTDMPCRCSPAVSGLALGANSSNFTTGTVTIPTNSRTVYARFTSEPFNTSRVESSGGLGQYNSRTYSFSIGSGSYSFTARTKRPNLTEIFDIEGQPQSPEELPNPDIDTLATPNPLPFINSNGVTLNDAEIPVEVKASLPDVQVRVNNGGWSDVRQIGTPP